MFGLCYPPANAEKHRLEPTNRWEMKGERFLENYMVDLGGEKQVTLGKLKGDGRNYKVQSKHQLTLVVWFS